MRLPVIALAGLVVLGACGAASSDDPGPQGGPSSTSTATTTTAAATTTTVTSPPVTSEIEVVAVHRDVEYYGACGNEVVEVDGITYYPMLFDDVQALDLTRYPVVPPDPLHGFRGEAVRVAPPGPGDDIGTFVVYADGTARFESRSGWVIWLTTTTVTYGWEC